MLLSSHHVEYQSRTIAENTSIQCNLMLNLSEMNMFTIIDISYLFTSSL